MTSIFHCEQCGGLLASREELTEGMCLACQIDHDWQAMQQARTGTTHTYNGYVTEKRADDWSAYLAGDCGQWEAGRTEAEALGNLYIRLWREQQRGA